MSIKTYTKRPVQVQAIEWTGANLFDVISFTDGVPDARSPQWHSYVELVADAGLKIYTLEGAMSASIGDYIIRGVAGEFYPCKPDIFLKTYVESD